MSLRDTRIDYTKGTLEDDSKNENPIDIFNNWIGLAKKDVEKDYNAMALSTQGLDGFPVTRIVLLRGMKDEGLVFYTNYESDKGKEIAENAKVSVNFFWRELEKQIRVNGMAKKLDPSISDSYFASRPRKSQIGAWVSDQSTIITSRAELTEKERELQQRFEGKEVPRPEYWGGYVIQPEAYEFWQGRSGRLHDRLKFKLTDGKWMADRLSP
ncbi:MAG: pyridoxamine 5'-phosphate oxidase [Flavobacteriales bacterium]